MKSYIVAAAIAALALGAADAAPLSYTPVVSGGSYAGSLAPLNNGTIPANGSPYNTSEEVHDYTTDTVFSLDFGKAVTITDILATVDHNDDYQFAFFDFSKGGNGSNLPVKTLTILASDGSVTSGVETFASFTGPNITTLASLQSAPIVATTVNVYSLRGDGKYGIGEVQFFSSTSSAAPEPAAWITMIGGFGLVGWALRRREAATRFA